MFPYFQDLGLQGTVVADPEEGQGDGKAEAAGAGAAGVEVEDAAALLDEGLV
jgi:hypothetical protein